jgi:hypothetical protein
MLVSSYRIIAGAETALKIQIWPITALVLLGITLIGLPACGESTKTTPTATPPISTFTTNTSFKSVNGLMLSLSLNATTFQPGQEISVVIDEQNTLPTGNNVSASNNWPLNGLSLGSTCETYNYPMGVAIFQGYYTSSNVSSATPLQLYNPGISYHCPVMLAVGYYSFAPLSDIASVFYATADGFGGGPSPYLTDFKVSSEIKVTGCWTNGQEPTLGNFTPGIYTVVGGDEWGTLAVLHFVVQAGPVMTASPQNTSPTATPNPTATTVASEYSFIPGNVLAGLPVYPGAIPTTFLDSEASVSVPFSRPLLIGSLRPGYQSASAQYSVKAYDHDIMNWYVNELSTKGYRLYGGVSTFSMGTVGGEEIAFFLPSQPLVSVEVHLYDMAGETILELLVTYSVPLPKPPEESLPDDIDSITVTYFSGNLTTVKTITDSQTITQLVSMVNALPVRPDYVYSCPIGVETRTIFSLVFHSQSEGNITVSDVIGCQVGGIYMGDYPILEDVHGLLREAIEQVLGISST